MSIAAATYAKSSNSDIFLQAASEVKSISYFAKIQVKLVIKCLDHKSQARRLNGMPLAIGLAFLTVAQYVAAIGESIIRGYCNLFDALITLKGQKAKIGVIQLGMAIGGIVESAFLPITIPLGLLVCPFAVAIIPDATSAFIERCNEVIIEN